MESEGGLLADYACSLKQILQQVNNMLPAQIDLFESSISNYTQKVVLLVGEMMDDILLEQKSCFDQSTKLLYDKITALEERIEMREDNFKHILKDHENMIQLLLHDNKWEQCRKEVMKNMNNVTDSMKVILSDFDRIPNAEEMKAYLLHSQESIELLRNMAIH